MRIYDISMEISPDMPVYKGKPAKRPRLVIESDFSSGSVYETCLEMNMHTGTHIDAPLHIIPGGSSIDKLKLDQVVTKCKVIDLSQVENQISNEHLTNRNILMGDFILLKTKNSTLDILESEFIFLDKSGAEFLSDAGVAGVGIDALGIERNQPDHETHQLLLSADIVILEGLRLKEVQEGEFLLAAAPLKLAGAEAAPVRAILIEL